MEVAVALFPIREGITSNGFHFHVNGQQVIAAVRPFLGNRFQEKVCIETFAHQATVQIGKRGNHGRDGPRVDEPAK